MLNAGRLIKISDGEKFYSFFSIILRYFVFAISIDFGSILAS